LCVSPVRRRQVIVSKRHPQPPCQATRSR
jgi:hypothetical protein